NGDGTLTSDEKSGIAPNDDGNTPSEVEVASITGDKAVEGTALTYDVTLNKVPTADTEVTLKLANGSGDVATDLGKEIEVSTDGGNTWTKVTPDADGNFKVTVPAGSTNGIKVQVPTVDDTAVEGDETIRLEGKTATQTDTVVGEGTIVDNDVTGREPPAPTVAQDPDHKGGMVITPADKADKLEVKYTDESDQPQTITVVKDPATGEWKPEGQLPSKDITVDPATGKVTLSPKDVKDGSDVTATNNVGPDSSVPAHGKADSNDVNPNPPQPNEPVVTISGSDKVNEGETATYTVKLDKPADKDVTVTVTLTHKGTEDADFTTAPDATKTLTIKAGETEAKITLEAAKDGKFEGAEHYNLSISNPQGAQLGTETSVDTQIVDVDTPPPPAVDQDPDHKGGMVITPTDGADKLEVKYTDESDQPQTITVVKDPTTGEWKPEGQLPHKDITVDPKTGKVTLPPDAVKDQSDVIAENSGGGKTSEGKGTAGEDDANQPQPVEPKVSISGDENVTEGNSATYKVTLDKPADKDITVTVTLKHGETSDADFSPAPEINKTLTIPAGKTEVEFKLNTVDDKQAEGKETYSLTLSEPKGAQLGDHTSVTTAINDATTPPPAIPQVKSVSSPQAEEGKALVYEVALDAPQADTPVELTLKNGTATLGTDTGKPVEVSTDGGNTWTEVTPDANGKFSATVPAGSENGVKVRVPTVTDTVTEQDETLTLEAGTAGQTTPASGEGTIKDVVATPPEAPTIADGDAKGSVVITPNDNADSLKVSYKDEDGNDRSIELHKENGKWVAKEPLPKDVKLDETSGKLTLEPEAVKDQTEVTATNGHGGADSAAVTHNAGEDDPMQGNATTKAVDDNLLGFNGEYYGYNDNTLQSQINRGEAKPDQIRYHADDSSLPDDTNVRTVSTVETLVNGREGSTLVGTSRAAKNGTPDARFKATNIHYGMDPEVNDNLGNNQKTAAGEKVGQGSAIHQFLAANSGSDADSLRAEAGVPNKDTSGLGYTTDSMVRIAGKVYFKAGYYDFSVTSDDGFRMRIDDGDTFSMEYNGNRMTGAPPSLSTTDHPNGVYIPEGFHNVEMLYWEQGSYARLHMQYKEHSQGDDGYHTMNLSNTAMLHPEANLDLNQLQDLHNNNGTWEVRTGSALDGNHGSNHITGSEGRDFLYGHEGDDQLTGGEGRDTFIFHTKADNGHDVIKDFKVGEDKIALTDVLDVKNIDPAHPNWKPTSEIQNAQWNDSEHKLTYDTTDAAGKTYHNSITFEGMTHSYSSAEEFLKDNTHII
ncbi:immunoglobulin-like domain-containing protein, partial [Cardiobacterium hominis]|uniref:immunoglobulin-like domain-containing protein n=1 Tax=Cardiobacterium hominis TaxID=2718 RepID=UPI0028E94A10